MSDLREKLAAYAHDEAWGGWMRWMFKQGTFNKDGTWTMPADKAKRWKMQSETDYAVLPEEMKPSDREQADMILDIVSRYLRGEE